MSGNAWWITLLIAIAFYGLLAIATKLQKEK